MNTDLLIEKLAYKNALEMRLCPPLDLLIAEQTNKATLHLERCGLCQLKLEMKEDYEAIKEFTDKFKTQREPSVNKTLCDGQLWRTSISLWGVDGNYYNSITVAIISVDDISHSCRVAMHFHDALLSGPGDVLLDGFPGFAEGWNTFNLHADFFKDGTYIDEITNDNLSELKRMDIYFNKNLYREIYFCESVEEMDDSLKQARLKFESIIADIDSRNFKQIKKGTARYEFRKTEIKVSSLFGRYTTQMLMDEITSNVISFTEYKKNKPKELELSYRYPESNYADNYGDFHELTGKLLTQADSGEHELIFNNENKSVNIVLSWGSDTILLTCSSPDISNKYNILFVNPDTGKVYSEILYDCKYEWINRPFSFKELLISPMDIWTIVIDFGD